MLVPNVQREKWGKVFFLCVNFVRVTKFSIGTFLSISLLLFFFFFLACECHHISLGTSGDIMVNNCHDALG